MHDGMCEYRLFDHCACMYRCVCVCVYVCVLYVHRANQQPSPVDCEDVNFYQNQQLNNDHYEEDDRVCTLNTLDSTENICACALTRFTLIYATSADLFM